MSIAQPSYPCSTKKQLNRTRLMEFALISANPVKKVNTTGLPLFTPETAKELSVHRDPLHLCRKRQTIDQRAMISSPPRDVFRFEFREAHCSRKSLVRLSTRGRVAEEQNDLDEADHATNPKRSIEA